MKFILLVLLSVSSLLSQDFRFNKEIGNFRNANSFFISPAGFIYVTDLNENKVYKVDTLGNVLKDIGGYGWDESGFDAPVDAYATPLNVYVTDKNNHRIQWFDKDLNFLSSLQTRNTGDDALRFGYPLSSGVTSQGDLIILDSENNRIIKFDMFGDFITEFGGLDAGKFRVNKPVHLALRNNSTYVLDSRGKRIVVFDQFGTGVNIIPLEQKMENISSSEGTVLLNNRSDVYSFDDRSGQLLQIALSPLPEKEIRDVSVFNNHLYILTPGRILVYDLVK